jgi:hypothetical protein
MMIRRELRVREARKQRSQCSPGHYSGTGSVYFPIEPSKCLPSDARERLGVWRCRAALPRVARSLPG